MKTLAKQKSQISFSSFFPFSSLLPTHFSKTQSFLRFASILHLIALILEIIIDLTLQYEFTSTHLSLRMALYLSILFSNGALLLIPNIYPIKNFILISTFHLTTFLIRLFLYKDKNSSTFDFEIIPSALYSLPLYAICILLTPKPKFRLFLVFLHQITILSLLNIKWNLTLNYNLKLVIVIFINLAVFWKISDFSRKKKNNTQNHTTIENEKFNLNSENDWKNLVNSIPQGIMLISHDKEILYSNNFSLDLLDLDSYTISSKSSIYQNLVKKFGKLEEIQYFMGNNNSEAPKPGEYGFTINESSYSGHNKNNTKKKAFLGLYPVNIYSSRSFQSKFKVSGPISTGNPNNAGILINWTKEKIDVDKRNSFGVNMAVSAKISLGEKVVEKSEDVIESFKNYSPISIIPLHEMNLDSILNRMTSRPSRTFKCYYSEPSDANKRKLELKIKNIVWEKSPAFLLTIQDVSYLKFFQQVCENNEYKNKVLTTLSHELRTPLNGALIPLEKLRNESLTNHAESFDYLDIAYKSMILLQDVLNDVVDFALINSNQLYLNYEELDIKSFLENTIDLFRKQAKEKGLFLELIYDDDLHRSFPSILKTDFQRLRQILVSLLNNALKNTFQGGISLIVSLIEKSATSFQNDFLRHCVKIIIKDTGVGIEDEKLHKIKKCLRGKDLMNVCENLNKNQGCGLGLIISHCLALLLGPPDSNGLKVNSQAMIGSEFSFCFESIQIKDQKSKNFEYNNKMKTMASFSTGDFCKKKKEKMSPDSEDISNEDFIYSAGIRDRKLCESQENQRLARYFP